MTRLRSSLRVTGLADRFGDAVFSADAVERGKPAPDLFLHVAERIGVEPTRCLVVEDSRAGIVAAAAAGMVAVGFTGGGHATGTEYRESLMQAGAATVLADADALAAYLRAATGKAD